jgi:hypothetical protein
VNRRSILKGIAGFGALGCRVLKAGAVASALGNREHSETSIDPRRFGAKGDGTNKDTVALQQAIDACFHSGGGKVNVSPGTYLTGTLLLKSNVTLYLEAGATLLGSPDVADYVLPDDARAALRGADPKHLIFAYRAENVGIAGHGTVDGNSARFLVRTGRPEPKKEDLWKDVSAWGWKRVVAISPMVELAACNNVRVEDVTLQNAVGWTLRPIACNGVTIRGVRIRNPIYSPNTDGIDPTSSQNVMISHCDIITGDDAICVKNLSPYGGDNRVCRNVTITDCVLSTGTNGFKVGIEGFGTFENIVFSNSLIYNDDVAYNERATSGIAIEMPDGGSVNGVTVSNITMKNVRTPIFLRLQNRMGKPTARMTGSLHSVEISDVSAKGAILTSSITGIPGYFIDDVTLRNINIETEEEGNAQWANDDVPERENSYPEAHMFGRLPSYGLYCRHVKGLKLQNIKIASKMQDPRPLLTADDVDVLSVLGIDGTPSGPGQGFLDLRNVRNALIKGNVAPENTGIYARISGQDSRAISLIGNDLRRAKTKVDLARGVPLESVRGDISISEKPTF